MYTREDRDDLNGAVDTAEERGLECGEAEGGDDDLALVGERVGDVVEEGEERKEIGFGIGEGFDHSEMAWVVLVMLS